jgi:hypothetical protein
MPKDPQLRTTLRHWFSTQSKYQSLRDSSGYILKWLDADANPRSRRKLPVELLSRTYEELQGAQSGRPQCVVWHAIAVVCNKDFARFSVRVGGALKQSWRSSLLACPSKRELATATAAAPSRH